MLPIKSFTTRKAFTTRELGLPGRQRARRQGRQHVVAQQPHVHAANGERDAPLAAHPQASRRSCPRARPALAHDKRLLIRL